MIILHSHNWFLYCIVGPPYAPEIINNETEIYGITPNVTVQWTRPGERNCNITMYSLHFNVVQPAAEKMTEINIPNVSVTSFKLQFQHSKKYEVTVFARNKIGQSEASKAWQIRTQQCKHAFFGYIINIESHIMCCFLNVRVCVCVSVCVWAYAATMLSKIDELTCYEIWMYIFDHFSDLQVNSYPIWIFSLSKYFGKTIFLIKSLWMFHTRPCFHYNFISTHGTKTLQRELFFSIYMAIA